MRIVILAAAALASLLSASPAHAQLSINRLWVDLAAGSTPRADLVIRNDSEDRYYISVSTLEVLNPGTAQEATRQLADPEQLGLLVTPNRLILEPGASRSIRLVSLNENLPTDRIYRVLVRPEIGAIDGPEVAPGESGLAIKVLAAYDVLVVARARAAAPTLVVDRRPAELVLRNTGNSNLLLFDGRICPSGVDTGESCRSVPARRLYSGNEMVVALQAPGETFFVKEQREFSGTPRESRY